jgi:hypothetical protein
MSQVETIKKQIEAVDKVAADARKKAEEIRQEIGARISKVFSDTYDIPHTSLNYSIDTIQLGASEGRNSDLSIYMRSDWDDETKVSIELNWYASSAKIGVEGDKKHFRYLIMAGAVAEAAEFQNFVDLLIETRKEYQTRVKETGVHDLYSLKEKLERELHDTEKELRTRAAKASLRVDATYIVKKRIDYGRRDAYRSWDAEHPVKLTIKKLKAKTADVTCHQWNNWDTDKAEYRPYGTRQHKMADIIRWIENGYMEIAQ